jgi:hypothetical protein
VEDETGNLEMLEEDEDAGSENAGNDDDDEEYVDDDQLDLVEMEDLEEQVRLMTFKMGSSKIMFFQESLCF